MLQSDGTWWGDKIYSCADTSQTEIKGWKASVLTYWAFRWPPCPLLSPTLLMSGIFTFLKSQSTGPQTFKWSFAHSPRNSHPLLLDPKPMFALVPSLRVSVRGLFTLPFTKTWGIILSGLQLWKQFTTPFSAAVLEIASIGYFWPQSKSCHTWRWPSRIWLYSRLKHCP